MRTSVYSKHRGLILSAHADYEGRGLKGRIFRLRLFTFVQISTAANVAQPRSRSFGSYTTARHAQACAHLSMRHNGES